MTTRELLDAICIALEREPGTLSIDDTQESIEEWDSLGTLSIIATVDQELGFPMDDEKLLGFRSMRELIDLLNAEGLLRD